MKITSLTPTELCIEHNNKTIILDPSREYPNAVCMTRSDGKEQDNALYYPGEYDISDISIIAHKTENGIVFRFLIDGVYIMHLGKSTSIDSNDFEKLYPCNVLLLPSHFNERNAKEIIDDFAPEVILFIGENTKEFIKKLGVSPEAESQTSFSVHKKTLEEENTIMVEMNPISS